LEDEIQENHVSRIRSLGLTAKNLETDLAITWHQDPWEYQKDYENSKFRLAEKMYTEARGMAADMIDLLNLAVRLEDFLGKKGKSAKNSGSNKASPDTHLFVAQTRLNDLRTIKSTDFDLAKIKPLFSKKDSPHAPHPHPRPTSWIHRPDHRPDDCA
jgi:hypothetical protein